MKKKLLTLASALLLPLLAMAQGWPANYGGVMLQGFFWDSWTQTPINSPRGGALNFLDSNTFGLQDGYTWATMYGAGWSTGEEWQVPLTTWNSLIAHKDEIAPYIDLLWLPQSGSTICPPTTRFKKSQDTSGRNAVRAWRNGSWYEFTDDMDINQPDCMGFVPVFYFHHGIDNEEHPWTYDYHWGSYTDEHHTNEIRTFTPKSYFGTENELRQLISEYKAAGTGAVEDVVANHRGCFGTWTFTSNDGNITYDATKGNLDFPTELYTGQFAGLSWEQIRGGQTVDKESNEYISWNTDDVCCDDESSYPENGGHPTGYADCGGQGEWARDIDHHRPTTRAKVVKYLDFLRNNLGYLGFRYDYAMGFEGIHYGEYNTTLRPPFSVGEYWGDIANITSWIGSTSMEGSYQSAAFDFPLMSKINEAFNDGHYRWLRDAGLIGDHDMRRYAVTFVDNHDTFKDLPTDGSNYNYQHRTNKSIEEANAFILAMPGTPCLFYPHFMHPQWHEHICNMVKARRAAGVHNMSEILSVTETGSNGITWVVQGTHGNVCLQLGDAASGDTPTGYQEVFKTSICRYSITSGLDWQNNTKSPLITGYPIISRGTCAFSESITINVKPSLSDVTLVYTTDGTTPTSASPTIPAGGKDFTFTDNTQLKVGVLTGNVVQSIVSNTYSKTDDAGLVTIYVQASDAPNLYLWSNTKDFKPNGGWAGNKTTEMKTVKGVNWHCKSFPLPDYSNGEYYNLIINWDGGSQSHPITGITSDRYFNYVNGQPVDVTEEYIGTVLKLTADKEDGIYDGSIDVTLKANDPSVTIVYTTDGSAPTAGSATLTGSGKVTISGNGNHVLRAGLLVGENVINEITHTYIIQNATHAGTHIFVRSQIGTPHLFIYNAVTSDQGSENWPGVELTQTVQDENGFTWYYYENENLRSCDIVLSDGVQNLSDNEKIYHQTEDITGVSGYVYITWDAPNRYMNVTGLNDHKSFLFFEPSNNNWNTWVNNYEDVNNNYPHSGQVNGRALMKLYDKTVSEATNDYYLDLIKIGSTNGGNTIYKWSNNESTAADNENITFKRMCPLYYESDHHQWNYSNNTYTLGGYYYTDDNLNGDWNNAVNKSDQVNFANFKYPTVTHKIGEIMRALLAEVEKNGTTNNNYTIDENLTVGYIHNNAIYAFNAQVDASEWQNPSDGNVDYVQLTWGNLGKTTQHNWVKITGSNNINNYQPGSVLSNVTGQLTDDINTTINLILEPIKEREDNAPNLNIYTPCNFGAVGESQTQTSTQNGQTYFFYHPQINEIAHIKGAVYKGEGKFEVPERTNETEDGHWINGAALTGSITVDLSTNNINLTSDDIGMAVDFDVLITHETNNTNKASDKYDITAISANQPYGVTTAVTDVKQEAKVTSVRFFNLQGMSSDKPFSGINIVVTTFDDGSRTSTKQLFK